METEIIAKAKREYETGKIGFVQALEQVFKAASNYRAIHPIENKEGVKSVEDIVQQMVEEMPFHMDKSCKPYIYEAMELYHSQFTPIEQGNRMVDVEFLQYVSNERKAAVDLLSSDWLNKKLSERVLIENLLIAYDQMTERIKND